MTGSSKSDETPSIFEGVEGQNGARWLRCGTKARNVWVSLVEISSLDAPVLARLMRVGFGLVTNRSKEKFKRDAEAFTSYRRALLAERPGWIGETYVHGNGQAYSFGKGDEEIVVTFDGDDRFAPTGSLDDWQKARDPIIRDQPLLLLVMSFAFVGPLLRFMPLDVQNPIIEIVGPKERGKSSLVHAASSVSGGDPNNRMGTARSWNFSPEKLDEMRASFADGLLVLDEANHAGKSDNEKAEKIGAAIFRLSETASRERFREVFPAPVRHAVLSTSNQTLSELVGSRSETQAAVISRVLTIPADRVYGIFDVLPADLTAREAAEALTAVSTQFPGTAAHAFSARLTRWQTSWIINGVAKGMRKATAFFTERGLDPRHAKILAAAYVAGRIAQQLGVIPKAWGSISSACNTVLPCTTAKEAAALESALEPIRRYIENHKSKIVHADRRAGRLSATAFDRTAGFLSEDGQQIIIPTKAAARMLPGHIAVMRGIKAIGKLDHDKGFYSKKAPRSLAFSRRAYFVKLE